MAEIIRGDIVDQRVDAIVNAWNRNVIPWWLLWPHGVSAAIKKRAGLEPFREVARFGPIPLGKAVLTSPGRLAENGVRGIIHVAGINLLWRASEKSIRGSVRSAMDIAVEQQFGSIAFPIIGAGAGGFGLDKALALMENELAVIGNNGIKVLIVQYARNK